MDPATSFLAVNVNPARTKRVTDGMVGNVHRTRFIIPIWQLRSIGAFLAGWLTLSGALLLVRSSLDATQRLGLSQLSLVIVGVMAAACLSRMALAFAGTGLSAKQRCLSLRERAIFRGAKDDDRPAAWPAAFVSIGLLLWGTALSRVGGSATAVGFFWLLFVLEEGWAWRPQLPYFRRAQFFRATLARPASDGQIIQQFTRTLTADGVDAIRGSLAVLIERGSRTGIAHVAFCPPFAERPQFDAHFAEPQSATFKVTQFYAHGARIEVRLAQATQVDTTLSVRFVARARGA